MRIQQDKYTHYWKLVSPTSKTIKVFYTENEAQVLRNQLRYAMDKFKGRLL
jgi:hypothetical protein